MPTWIPGRIIQNIHWTDRLFSLTVHAEIDPFIAGQFTKIRLTINQKNIQRAYSYLNAPHDKDLTFYLTTVPKGKLSHILYKLQQGDTIALTKKSYGHFTLENIPNCENLWMIATGTGIAPYLSMLTYGKKLKKFSYIILVYAVRFLKDINYLNLIKKLQKKYQKQLKIQIILSKEHTSHTLTGHIQDLIANGSLEKTIGLKLKTKNNHIMLCGNPNMIHETQKLLKKKYNMKNHTEKNLGHITTERYW